MIRASALMALLLAGPAIAAPPAAPPGDPEVVEAQRLLGQGRPALSVPLLETVLARLPGNPDLLTYLGLALRQSGRPDAAGEAYAAALRSDAWHAGALAYQGVLFLDQGERERASANLARLVGLCPAGCAERAELEAEIARR